MITYSTWSPATPARSRAALMASAPRSTAAKPLREPSRRPMGVRAPATMTDAAMKPDLQEPGGTTFANIPTRGQCTSWEANAHAHAHRPRRDRLPRPRGEDRLLRDDVRAGRGLAGGQRGAGRQGGDAARRRR